MKRVDRETELLAAGPGAVVAALESSPGELHLEALAMACSRLARSAESVPDALEWVDASSACSFAEAASCREPWIRQGREYSAHGIAVWCICRFGPDAGTNRERLAKLAEWTLAGTRSFPTPSAFRSALLSSGDERSAALLLQERLRLAREVRDHLPETLGKWIDATGFEDK